MFKNKQFLKDRRKIMANKSDIVRNGFRLTGPLAKRGYDWWWHNMTAINKETGEEKPFFIEFFVCNPALAKDEPVIVWNRPEAQKAGERPSYVMVKCGFWGEKERDRFTTSTHGRMLKSRRKAPSTLRSTAATAPKSTSAATLR